MSNMRMRIFSDIVEKFLDAKMGPFKVISVSSLPDQATAEFSNLVECCRSRLFSAASAYRDSFA
jgi:hypothetical protein